MDISKIIYYTKDGDSAYRTISLRNLCLREEVEFEAVFHAVRDAIDETDLLDRFRRICCDQVELDPEEHSSTYIRFIITDVYGNTNYLKFRKRRTM
jgi:hypothetical protein